MFNRLKSLPLTIVLTVLIWMYAEAQFTNTQENVQLNVKLLTPSPDLAVRAIDPVRNRPGDIINAVVTLQGPRNELDAIFQQSQGVPDEEFASLAYQPRQRDLRAGEETTVNVVTMLNTLNYFRSRRVTVISAAPSSSTCRPRCSTGSAARPGLPSWPSRSVRWRRCPREPTRPWR
jgi:hypothetical protein